MPTTIGGRKVATKKSGHRHVGPPAVSMIPPMAPPTPPGVPSPFVYLGTTKSASGTKSKLKIQGGATVVMGNKLAVDKPGNQPAQATPKKDLVTTMVNSKVVVG